MKKIFNVFATFIFVLFLSGCQTHSISSNGTLSSNIDQESSDNVKTSSESPIDSLTKKLPAHYYDVIDPFLDVEFDYKHPISAAASLERKSSYHSLFEGESCYELLSMFDDANLQYVLDYSTTIDQQFIKDLLHGISISVKYSNPLSEDSVSVRFRISEDGRLGFLTANQTILFYTDSETISYDDVKNRIMELDDYYSSNSSKSYVPTATYKSKAFSTRQNRTDYIMTPNGSGVVVYYDSEMSQGEIDYWNQYGDDLVDGATRIADSSALYNCHSYAWYLWSTSNTCWIEDISPYIDDSTYEEIGIFEDVEIGDIICYFDSNDHNDHSGVVVAKTEGTSNNVCGNSNLVTVVSKWGEWALYEHRGDQCPYTYPYGGDATYVKYYRVHYNESIPLSNPSTNTTQIINRYNYVEELVYYGQTSNYAMFELDVTYTKLYSFEITADYYLEVNLFKGPMQEENINNATVYENGIYRVSFNYYASPEKYYLRVTYENSSRDGTIHTQITNQHTHLYSDSFLWYNFTKHSEICVCNDSTFGPHVVSANIFNKGNQYALCLLCHGPASIGILPLAQSSLPTSLNGSFILPNGVIVLVDEDLEAFLNGTLVFLPPNSY